MSRERARREPGAGSGGGRPPLPGAPPPHGIKYDGGRGRRLQEWLFDVRSRPFVLLAAAFAAASLLVASGATAGADAAVSSYFHGLAGNLAADLFMESVTEVGDVFYMLAFAVALIIVRRTRRIGIVLMILLVLSTLVTGYVKCGVDRDRPGLEFAGHPFVLDLSGDTFSLFCAGGLGASYPSGHVGRAAVFGIVLAFVLSERFPRGCYLLLLYPALMALSRIYLMEHYPMDVVGSGVLGALLAGAVGKKTGLRPWGARRPPAAGGPPAPGSTGPAGAAPG